MKKTTTKTKRRKKRCGLYGRVSTDRQARIQDGGLATQFDLMEKRVEYENARGETEWQIVEQYREEGRSGKDLDRPEFKRMIRDIEEGKINTVIVYKLDRISRSVADFLNLLKKFREHDVEFLSLNEHFDTTTAQGRMALTILLAVAEMERELASERTRDTMRYRAEQGFVHGGRYVGYDLDPDNKGVLKVNPEWARIVREDFFRKCLELGSAGAVTRHLRKHGIRKPTYQTRRGNTRGGMYFQKQEVVRVLENEIYLGKIRYDGELYDGRHEAIIDQELFDRVQRLLDRNRKTGRNARDPNKRVYVLSGLMRCGRCGSMLTPKHCSSNGTKHHYYTCTQRDHSAGSGCDMKYIPAEPAEDFVLGELRQIGLDRQLVEEVVRHANGARQSRLESLQSERRSMQRRTQDTQKRIASLVAAIESGTSVKSLEVRLAELEDELASLGEEMEALDREVEATKTETISANAMAEDYRDLPEILDELEQAGDRATINELLHGCIEVIDWHQDEDDPSRGEVEIMLFEQQLPFGERLASAKETLNGRLVTSGCVERNKRLPP